MSDKFDDALVEKVSIAFWAAYDLARVSPPASDEAIAGPIASLVRREVEQARADERGEIEARLYGVERCEPTMMHAGRGEEVFATMQPWKNGDWIKFDDAIAAIRARGEQHGTGEGQNHG